ncbi:energy transducer TonB family protein [Leptospira interrogans]
MTPGGTTGDVETLRQLLLRWGLAAIFVLLAHGGVAFAIAYWPEPEEKAGEPPAAVMIELAPLPVAPETPPQEVAVGIQQEMSDQSTPNDAKEEPVEEEPPQPEIEVAKSEPLPDPPPEPVERDVETETPELPQIADAEAVLDAPTPPPPPEVIEKRPEEEEKKPELKKKPKPKQSSVAKSASAPKPVEAKRANTNAAPTAGVGATMSISTWRGSVMAHLNRHKRYPGSGGGTSSVAFTIDRSGRVLSARLIRSSGSSILDQEAVALARRASPLPAPPANVGGGSVVLTVPVRFSR